MKKYATFYGSTSKATLREQLYELLLFQLLLEESSQLNDRFHGKAKEIAVGLQPWIDALQMSLE